MSNLLVVPIHLDALHLQQETHVAGSAADFSKLPYHDGAHDQNADTPNLGDAISSQPFSANTMHLQPGVHLHWALPDAMVNGEATTEGLKFPAVPNRWLVIRTAPDGTTTGWVRESDYLYPENNATGLSGITYPVLWPNSGRTKPFAYLGRKVAQPSWQEDPGAEYLMDKTGYELTALGYGVDPAFAAFYPSCHSVFGLYDNEPSGNANGYTYEVWGWYSNGTKDFIKTFIGGLEAAVQSDPEAVKTAIEEELKWHIGLGTGESGEVEIPEATICYGKLQFTADTPGDHAGYTNADTTVAMGNSATEALAAYLAQKNQSATVTKKSLEQALEAVILNENLENKELDIEHQIEEDRHKKGFKAFNGGLIWTIRSETKNNKAANAQSADEDQQITLPEALAEPLNALNLVQEEYDRSLAEIESRQVQLFSDWYKYMLAANPPHEEFDAYPDMGLVRTFIQNKDLYPLREKINATAEIRDRRDDAWLALQTLIDSHNAANAANTTQLKITQVPADPYYQPSDPVIVLSGLATEATSRHGQDGSLREDGLMACLQLKDLTLSNIVDGSSLAAFRGALAGQTDFNGIAESAQSTHPWNPFLLEWDVEAFPVDYLSNVSSGRSAFDPQFIPANYDIPHEHIDFQAKAGTGLAQTSHAFTGKSYLSSHARQQFRDKLEVYLEQYGSLTDETVTLLQDVKTTVNNSNFHVLSQALGHFNEALTQYEYTLQWSIADPFALFTEDDEFAEAVAFMLYPLKAAAIWEQLKAKGWITEQPDGQTAAVAAVGGRHALDACFAFYRLRIESLLAGQTTIGKQDLENEFREATDAVVKYAVQPHNHFSPIRSGQLRINRLRLLDNFGVIKDIPVDESNPVTTIEALNVDGVPGRMQLLPRISQPARLRFRWLSAQAGEVEMNSHPASSPICGWILPNNLDHSLFVYNSQGSALGLFREDGNWEPFPGGAHTTIAAIANDYLRQVIQYLADQVATDNTFLQHFNSAINNALMNIHPENFSQHLDLAFLMGKPLAVVRTKLSLELKGLPAVDQSWSAFAYDLQKNQRLDDGFMEVQFPIRVGEYAQHNDGVVGYWVEADGGYANDTFYAPQTDQISTTHIATHHDGELSIGHALSDDPVCLTMLVDPRASVHATTGILPVKSIELPPDQYKSAVQNIAVTFRTMPLLTPPDRLTVPLPNEAGYQWSWLETDGTNWTEIRSSIRQSAFLSALDKGTTIWDELISKGWITVANAGDTTATVLEEENRTNGSLDDVLGPWLERIEALLESKLDDALNLDKADVTAAFDEGAILWRELLGKHWLAADRATVVATADRESLDAEFSTLETDIENLLSGKTDIIQETVNTAFTSFDEDDAVWRQLLAKNWLAVTEAEIMSPDRRVVRSIASPRTALADTVEELLQQHELNNPRRDVHFHEELVLKSGWLKLSPV